MDKGSVVVIGAGIIGICTAIELQRVGYQVTLMDKGEPADETSKGNASFIAIELIEPQATPHNILSAIKLTFSENGAFKVTPDNFLSFIPWGLSFLKEATKSRRDRSRNSTLRLNKYSVTAWTDLLERTGNLGMMKKCGYLQVWEKASALKTAIKNQADMQSYGFECEVISGDAIFEKEPALSHNIKHALFWPNSLQLLEPHHTSLKLFDHFIQQGGEFKQQAVQKLSFPDQGVNIDTGADSGKLHFDKAIVCAGVWSTKLCAELYEETSNKSNEKQSNETSKTAGLKIPLVPERGYNLTYPDSPVKFKHLIKSEDRNVVLTPLSTGMRIVGFGEFSKLSSMPVKKRSQQLNKHMDALIQDMNVQQQEPSSWMGHRPTTPDSLPVIDLHPQHPQLGMVFGHHHLGLTQAPISAKLITAMIEGDKSDQTLQDFADVIETFSVTRF